MAAEVTLAPGPHSLVDGFLAAKLQDCGANSLEKWAYTKGLRIEDVLGGRPFGSDERKKRKVKRRGAKARLQLLYPFFVPELSGCACEDCTELDKSTYGHVSWPVFRDRGEGCGTFAFPNREWLDRAIKLRRDLDDDVCSSEGELRRRLGINLSYYVIDTATGMVYGPGCCARISGGVCHGCARRPVDSSMADARRDGIGPFWELVRLEWKKGHRERLQMATFKMPMSPPSWANLQGGHCRDCGCLVGKGEGLFERTKVLARDSWMEEGDTAISECFCRPCFKERFSWFESHRGPTVSVLPDWTDEDGLDHEVIVNFNGVGPRMTGVSKKEKKALSEAYRKARNLKIAFTEAARKKIAEMPELEQRVAYAFAWNKVLADKYLRAGDRKRGNAVLGCRRCYIVFQCLEVRCGWEATGGVTNSCGDRLCAFCSEQRRNKTIELLFEKLAARGVKAADISMLTVTILNTMELSPDSWREFGHRVNQAFRLLAVLGHGVQGGFRALETTERSKETGHHLHSHALAEHAVPIPQRLLARVWLVASGGAGYVCDIRRSKNLKRAALETVKNGKGAVKTAQVLVSEELTRQGVDYLTKLVEITDPELLLHVRTSMDRVQMTQSFGAWRNAKLEREGEGDEEPACNDDLNHKGQPKNCPRCNSERLGKKRGRGPQGGHYLGYEKGAGPGQKFNEKAVEALGTTRRAQQAEREAKKARTKQS